MDPYKLILEAISKGARGQAILDVAKTLETEGVKVTLDLDPVGKDSAFHYVADTGPLAGQPGDKSGNYPCHVFDHPGSLTRLIVCLEDGWTRRVGKKVQ